MHQASRPQGIVYKILIFSQHAQTSPSLCVVPSHSWFGLFNSKSDRCRLPLVPRRWGCSWPGSRACVMLVVRRPHCPPVLLVSSFAPLCPFLSPAVMAHHRGGGGTRGHVALAGGVWRPLPKNISSSPSCSYHPSPGCRYVLAPCQDAVCVFNRLLVPRLTCWPRKIIWFEIIISYWAGFTE